jgi:hypothetical protein
MVDQLDLDHCCRQMINILALPLTKPVMGDNRDGYNGIKHCAIDFINKMQ